MPGNGKSILIVEDEEAIRVLIAELLQSKGYQTRMAADGSEALGEVDRQVPDLVLLDMRMPVMDGWVFAGILKQRRVNVPIIVFTAAENAQARAHELGAVGWISKPFTIEDLFDAVQRGLGIPAH